LTWVLFSAAAAAIARSKGRSAWGYFWISFFITPVLGILLAWALPVVKDRRDEDLLASPLNKKCPFCAEVIKGEARVCRFCGRELYQRVRSPDEIMAEARREGLPNATVNRTQICPWCKAVLSGSVRPGFRVTCSCCSKTFVTS
jgi:hypothetical protein